VRASLTRLRTLRSGLPGCRTGPADGEEADRIGDPGYGPAFAAAIPGAEFRLLERTGHMPQIETPDALVEVVWAFADTHATCEPAV
jgi:pimeloyl-ACP methyl ester carboxylesterase